VLIRRKQPQRYGVVQYNSLYENFKTNSIGYEWGAFSATSCEGNVFTWRGKG